MEPESLVEHNILPHSLQRNDKNKDSVQDNNEQKFDPQKSSD
jgi:hypothetical protein